MSLIDTLRSHQGEPSRDTLEAAWHLIRLVMTPGVAYSPQHLAASTGMPWALVSMALRHASLTGGVNMKTVPRPGKYVTTFHIPGDSGKLRTYHPHGQTAVAIDDLLRGGTHMTAPQLANHLGVTVRAVNTAITKARRGASGKSIRAVGRDDAGYVLWAAGPGEDLVEVAV